MTTPNCPKYYDKDCPLTAEMGVWGGITSAVGPVATGSNNSTLSRGVTIPPIPTIPTKKTVHLKEIKVEPNAYNKKPLMGDIKLMTSGNDTADHEGWLLMDGRTYESITSVPEVNKELLKLVTFNQVRIPNFNNRTIQTQNNFYDNPIYNNNRRNKPEQPPIETDLQEVMLTKSNIQLPAYLNEQITAHSNSVEYSGLTPMQKIPKQYCKEPGTFLTTYGSEDQFITEGREELLFNPDVGDVYFDFHLQEQDEIQVGVQMKPKRALFNGYIYAGILEDPDPAQPLQPRTNDVMFFLHGDDEKILIEEYLEVSSTLRDCAIGCSNNRALNVGTIQPATQLAQENMPTEAWTSELVRRPTPELYGFADTGYLYAEEFKDPPAVPGYNTLAIRKIIVIGDTPVKDPLFEREGMQGELETSEDGGTEMPLTTRMGLRTFIAK